MSIKSLFPALLISFFLFASCDLSSVKDGFEPEYQCEDGFAKGFPCQNVDLFAHLSLFELTGDSTNTRLNDIWGWTDPQTQKEYALVGYNSGVIFVDISNPNDPVVVGNLPESRIQAKTFLDPTVKTGCDLGIGTTPLAKNMQQGSVWRDMKVYNNHMYVVKDYTASRREPHGMQVFDLTKLREFDGSEITFSEDALYTKIYSAHNIVINEETGFAYATGITDAEVCGDRQGTGLHMIDIRNPKQPEYAGCYIDSTPGNYRIAPGYIHDAQCVIYNGPDITHRGKEVCFNSAEGNVVIADVTDKQDPVTIGFNRQPDMQYSHQGWLTEDHSYFLMNDELDELNFGRETKTYIWDVRDLKKPEFLGYYTHQSQSIDHNLYIKDNFAFESNYNAGLQILDLSGINRADLKRVAYFDTQPASDQADFEGTWSNYPFFNSGIVIVSDIHNGLFIVHPNL